MSRVVVAGIGTPTFVEAERHFGPGRRTTHFAFALADAGHDVTVLWRRDDGGTAIGALEVHATPRGSSFHARALPAQAYVDGRIDRAVVEIGPDAVVAASVHASADMARALAPRVPLWADVFGDPMAEAQAKALADRSDAALAMFWTTLAGVLARGDHFSAVSTAQGHALVGQLGLAGRLVGELAGRELVSVVPCAAEANGIDAVPWLRGRVVPDDAFVALFSGSFNTWCDVETMVLGLERAMDLEPALHFVATGGPVPGHHERGAETLAALIARRCAECSLAARAAQVARRVFHARAARRHSQRADRYPSSRGPRLARYSSVTRETVCGSETRASRAPTPTVEVETGCAHQSISALAVCAYASRRVA